MYVLLKRFFIFYVVFLSLNVFAEEASNESTIISNFGDRFIPQEKIAKVRIKRNIYDLGFVYYSQEFADRYGYVNDYVVPMDEGMHMLEFRMRTEGIYTVCYINVVLDDNIGLDFPDYSFSKDRFKPNMPSKRPELKDPNGLRGYYESEEDRQFRWKYTEGKKHYYKRNIYIASYDYHISDLNDRSKKTGGLKGVGLIRYDKTYYKNKVYFSLLTGCRGNNIIGSEDSSLWFKKKGGSDYTKRGNPEGKEFKKFRLPRVFKDRVGEYKDLGNGDGRLFLLEKLLKEELNK